jgi:hypothetical protein
MSAEDDRRRDAYLWDPSAPPSPEVQDLERRLAPLRFDARRRPLTLRAQAAKRWSPRVRVGLALAASLALLAIGTGVFLNWRLSWTTGAPWPAVIDTTAAGGTVTSTWLRTNAPLELGDRTSARVEIAHIGTLRAAPGSALTLTETTSARHRMALSRGSVSVRVWAPPGQFAFQTPAGSVRDLGCIFDLAVDADGTSRLRVKTGWVQLDNVWGESLVPAGASSVMTAGARPAVPIYDDSRPAFAVAVRGAEQARDGAARGLAIDAIVRTVRARDVFTLLMLANRSPMPAKRALLERAARLVPPPPGVSVDAIVAGERDQVWRWARVLDLPPVKSWWRNWRDVLPWRH